MTAKLNAEWRKLTTTRTLYWLLAAAAAVAAAGAFATTSATTQPPWHMGAPRHETDHVAAGRDQRQHLRDHRRITRLTDEFRHNTIAHTYIADPKRMRSRQPS